MALAAIAASAVTFVALAAVFGRVRGPALLLSSLALQASMAGFTLLWVARRYRGSVRALGLRSKRLARDVAFGAWAGVGLFALAVFLVLPALVVVWRVVTGGPPDPISQPVVPVDPTPVQTALGAAAAVVAAPIAEELFFRGFLFGSLRARLGFMPAGAISAAVFALFHGQPLLMAVMLFVGVGLAFIYDRRGALPAAISAHATFNLIGFTLILVERL